MLSEAKRPTPDTVCPGCGKKGVYPGGSLYKGSWWHTSCAQAGYAPEKAAYDQKKVSQHKELQKAGDTALRDSGLRVGDRVVYSQASSWMPGSGVTYRGTITLRAGVPYVKLDRKTNGRSYVMWNKGFKKEVKEDLIDELDCLLGESPRVGTTWVRVSGIGKDGIGRYMTGKTRPSVRLNWDNGEVLYAVVERVSGGKLVVSFSEAEKVEYDDGTTGMERSRYEYDLTPSGGKWVERTSGDKCVMYTQETTEPHAGEYVVVNLDMKAVHGFAKTKAEANKIVSAAVRRFKTPKNRVQVIPARGGSWTGRIGDTGHNVSTGMESWPTVLPSKPGASSRGRLSSLAAPKKEEDPGSRRFAILNLDMEVMYGYADGKEAAQRVIRQAMRKIARNAKTRARYNGKTPRIVTVPVIPGRAAYWNKWAMMKPGEDRKSIREITTSGGVGGFSGMTLGVVGVKRRLKKRKAVL